MKPIVWCSFLWAMCLTTAGWSQALEGIFEFTITGHQAFTAKCWVKGDRIYLEKYLNGDTIRRIIDRTNKEVITLVEDEGKNIAIRMNDRMSMYWKQVAEHHPSFSEPPTVEWDAVRETQKIQGQSCIKVIAKNHEYKATAWVDETKSSNHRDVLPFVFNEPHHLINQMDKVGFPLEWQQQAIREEQSWSTVAHFEAQKIPDEKFQVPAGFEEVDFTNTRQLMEQTKTNPRTISHLKRLMQAIDGE